MSELAEKLIAKNLKTKNPTLDLGNCGLDGTEDELYKPLRDATHLETLIFSDDWTEYNLRKQVWESKSSKNDYDNPSNILIEIPNTLPQTLEKLVLAGYIEYERYSNTLSDYRFRVKDLSILTKLTNLKALDLSYGNVEDISFLGVLKKLQSLNLKTNPIKNIEILKNIKSLKAIQLDLDNFIYPPIYLAKLNTQKGKLGDYVNIVELPATEKIWQIMSSKEEENINLAHQLAMSQGWTKEEFEMYQSLLN